MILPTLPPSIWCFFLRPFLLLSFALTFFQCALQTQVWRSTKYRIQQVVSRKTTVPQTRQKLQKNHQTSIYQSLIYTTFFLFFILITTNQKKYIMFFFWGLAYFTKHNHLQSHPFYWENGEGCYCPFAWVALHHVYIPYFFIQSSLLDIWIDSMNLCYVNWVVLNLGHRDPFICQFHFLWENIGLKCSFYHAVGRPIEHAIFTMYYIW